MHPWRTQIAQSSNAKSFNIQIKGGLKESNLVHHVILISMIFIQCNFPCRLFSVARLSWVRTIFPYQHPLCPALQGIWLDIRAFRRLGPSDLIR